MTDTYQQALALIEKANDILITTHTRPDGDACGCVAALMQAFRARGKAVRPLFVSPVPSWYAFLFDEKVPVLREDVQVDELATGPFGRCDLIVIVDTNSYSQLPHLADHLKRIDTPILVIDHHVTSDGLGAVEIVDATAAAAGLVVYDFFKAVSVAITAKIAEALFVAIATDTGWCQFSNTTSRVYRCAAELIDLGVSPTELYDKLYHTFSPARFRLLVTMLDRLELHLDGRYAVQHLVQEDFARTGAAYEDTENFINECHRIASVVVSALLVELKDGRVRCSLRSRGPVDVSKIAAQFGGGGHKMAAGTFLPGPIDHARQLIFDEVAQCLP